MLFAFDSAAVVDAGDSGLLRAMRAAIERAAALRAMADDHATAVLALRGEGVDRAFEGIESTLAVALGQGEGLVVVVAADIAERHCRSPVQRGEAQSPAPALHIG